MTHRASRINRRYRQALALLAVLSAPGSAAADVDLTTGGTGELSVAGRVFVRETAIHVDGFDDWQTALAIASARIAAKYRFDKQLKTEVELEFADGRAELKDVYVRYRPIPELRIQVGQFKRTISPISMESASTLPLIERGLLNDRVLASLFEIPLPLSGRSEAIKVTVRPKLALSPMVEVAVHNARLASRTDELPAFDESKDLLRDVYARMSIEPTKPLTIGAGVAAYTRVRNLDGDLKSGAMASVDVVWMSRMLSVWGEAFYGRTPYIDPTDRRARGSMWAARALVSPRFHDLSHWVSRVEPFAELSWLALSSFDDDATALEYSGGVSTTLLADVRAQVQVTRRDTGDSFPQASSTLVFVQIASTFEQ